MLNRFYSVMGWVLLVLLLLVATMVGLTRQFLPSIAEHKAAIEEYISDKANVPVSIEQISAHWEGRYPTFQLRNVRAYKESTVGPIVDFSVDQIDAEIDIVASVFARFLIFAKLDVEQAHTSLYQRNGRWGVEQTSSSSISSHTFIRQIINVLTQQPAVSFTNARLLLNPEKGVVQAISPITFLLNNADEQHYLYGSLALSLADNSSSNVEFAVETENLPLDPLAGDFKIYAKVNNLGQQLLKLDLVDLPFDVKELDIGTELWGRWRNKKADSLQGQLSVNHLSFEDESLESITDSAVKFSVKPLSNQKYNFVISDLLVKNSKAKIAMPFISAEVSWDEGVASLHKVGLKELDLGMWSQWFVDKPYVPEILNDTLSKLKPHGSLHNLQISWPDSENLTILKGEGDLSGVSVGGYYGAPVLKNVTGRIRFTESSGDIDLDATDFVMGFPELFAEHWKYNEASGRVSWVIEEREGHSRPVVTVNSGLLNVSNESLSAAGRFSIYLPLDHKKQTELTLLIALKNADAKQASLYMPPNEVGESLHRWVAAAVEKGTVNDGMLLLRTGTRRLSNSSSPTVQLYFDVDDASVKFQPDWPVVSQADIAISVDGAVLDIVATEGQFLNSQVSRVEVALPAKSNKLSVKTTVTGDAKDILILLRAKPLRAMVGDGLDSWSLLGKHKTEVNVLIPLSEKGFPAVKVKSRLDSGRFESKSDNIVFKKVSGNFDFSTQKSLSSNNIKATLMSSPVAIRIESVAKTSQVPAITRVYLSGKIAVDAIKKKTGLSILNSTQGSAPINARLDLCSGAATCNKLVVDSQLKGISLRAPAPFGKSADALLPLQVVGQLGSTSPVWRYKLGDQLRGVTKAIEGASRTRISFGGERPQEPLSAGLWVDGYIDSVDLTQLKTFMAQNGWWSGDSLSSSQEGLKQLALSIRQLSAGNIHVSNIDVIVNAQKESGTAIGFVSPDIAGEIRVPKGDGDVYKARLDHWYLRTNQNISVPINAPQEVLQTNEWPAVELFIKKIFLDSKPLGQWSMKIQPDSVGQLMVNNIVGSLGGFTATGEAGWQLQDNKPSSFIAMTYQGNDLGALLKHFGYGGVLESKTTNMVTNFSWSGYPWSFDTKNLDGAFKLLLKKGRIIDTGQHSNILRLFGILNLNTIARRLQLNFTDLLKTGVAFDRVSANYLLNNGIAYSQEPFSLDGPSANVNLSGSINIVDQTLDNKMDVVLPLTSNVPVAAVLLGAPQIAGAVFLLDKLIGDKLEKVSTLKYQLSGPWEEPDVKLMNPSEVKPSGHVPALQGNN